MYTIKVEEFEEVDGEKYTSKKTVYEQTVKCLNLRELILVVNESLGVAGSRG